MEKNSLIIRMMLGYVDPPDHLCIANIWLLLQFQRRMAFRKLRQSLFIYVTATLLVHITLGLHVNGESYKKLWDDALRIYLHFACTPFTY